MRQPCPAGVWKEGRESLVEDARDVEESMGDRSAGCLALCRGVDERRGRELVLLESFPA